jgi:hypothetical protein
LRIEKPLISDDQLLWVLAAVLGLLVLGVLGWRVYRK